MSDYKDTDLDQNIKKSDIVSQKHLRHFLDIEDLPKSLILDILDLAESFAGVSGQPVKKVPLLRGKTIVNLFFEASTRTRTTFELAAKRLSADFLNINIDYSATKKGEHSPAAGGRRRALRPGERGRWRCHSARRWGRDGRRVSRSISRTQWRRPEPDTGPRSRPANTGHSSCRSR